MARGAGVLWTILHKVRISGLLFGLKASDPMTIAAAVLLLSFVAALAGLLPAMRASRVDPIIALRGE